MRKTTLISKFKEKIYVQLVDRDNFGVISRPLRQSSKPNPFWGQFYFVQPACPPVRNVRRVVRSGAPQNMSNNVVFILQDSSATTSAVMLCQPQGYFFGESEPVSIIQNYWWASFESKQNKPRPTGSPALEMRSSHRPLSSKAREEMSDFEREYPW
jgi:hypothetical protein